MSQATMSTRSHAPVRGRRLRLLAGSVLAAGVLLLGAACGGGNEPGENTGENPAEDAYGAARSLKTCSLVDFASLTETLQADFTDGPKDVGPDAGMDVGGAQCVGQLGMPALSKFEGAEPTQLADARFAVVVLPYHSVDEATTGYEDRVAGAPEPNELSGQWERGIVSTDTGAESTTTALIQKGSLLFKVEVKVPNDESFAEKLPFTTAEVQQLVADMIGELCAAANTAIYG